MRTAIVTRALDAGAMLTEVSSVSNGAVVVFVGTVRDVNDDRDVTGLDYDAYVPMAERELALIVRDAELQWPASTVVCEHRIGSLALGDASVVVAASHPHRGEAFDACRFVIEELKKRLPIWKREHYADGALAWVENNNRNAEPRSARSAAEKRVL
jgi:molybdopterin synthase catalytic subunit